MYKVVFNQLLALPRYVGRSAASLFTILSIMAVLSFQAVVTDYSWVLATLTYVNDQMINGNTAPIYGPDLHPYVLERSKRQFYNFSQVGQSFAYDLDLSLISDIDQKILQNLLLQGVPTKVAKRMRSYLPLILDYSEKNQLDPLWVISVVWVESHFKKEATSPVRAAGLMQIMPRTGRYLNGLMNMDLPLHVSHQVNYDPHRNVELGTFYLKKLLGRFSGNYRYATVAYNMGPTYTMRRLARRRPVGTNNLYLKKVSRAYRRLSRPLKNYLRVLRPSYTGPNVYAFNAPQQSLEYTL